MRGLDNRLTADELKAPPGQLRLVKTTTPKITLVGSNEHFLVEDFTDKYPALERWRSLSLPRTLGTGDKTTFTLYDDHGRVVDAIGAIITEAERKAPPGMYRVICGDISTGVIKLVADLTDRDEAIKYAQTADEGPYTGFQVHDDTGKALLEAA